MGRLYYISTNAYDMVVSVDDEGDCRYLTGADYDGFPYMADLDNEGQKAKAMEFLNEVEDDSSWSNDLTYDELLGFDPNEIDAPVVLAERSF